MRPSLDCLTGLAFGTAVLLSSMLTLDSAGHLIADEKKTDVIFTKLKPSRSVKNSTLACHDIVHFNGFITLVAAKIIHVL